MTRDGWRPFAASASSQLSAAKRAGRRCVHVHVDAGTYEVDLQRMEQRNISTGTVRPVREA
eukprot:4762161-Prymnesium_polylepis.1